MVSWQARLLNGAFRFLMKRHGDRPIDLARLRSSRRHPPRRALRVPGGYRVDELRTPEDLRFDIADRAAPRGQPPATIVLYMHGGGYLTCSPKTHRPIIMAMAEAFDAPAYGLDYRLAPEHPFPAAVEDATSAYRWLLEKHPNARIVLAGDSAGGGLAIATALAARNAGMVPARAIVGFSPWTDLAVTGASIEANARSCAMFTPKGIRAGATLYLAGADPRDPRASPLYANLSGLPPMLLFASRHETLLDDTVRLADRATVAGVDVDVVLRDSLPHVWPVFLRFLPEAREALKLVRNFADRVTSVPSTGA